MEVSFAPTVVLSHTPAPLSFFSTSFFFLFLFPSQTNNLFFTYKSLFNLRYEKKKKKPKKLL